MNVIVGVKVVVAVKVGVMEGMIVSVGVGVVVGPQPSTLQELKIIGRTRKKNHNNCFRSGFFMNMQKSET